MAASIRPVKIRRKFTKTSPGSVLYQCGETIVLCTASIENRVPPWMIGKGRGWVTAEYNMLPHSTQERKPRERAGKIDGRTTEIQRLIGRSLRAIVDLDKLGERMVTVDCDVLQADGGTRTASITGGFIALVDALHGEFGGSKSLVHPITDSVAAISVGVVGGKPVLDLNYEQDVDAEVDMNVVMTGSGRFIELQGTGEEATFDDDDLAAMLKLAKAGIKELSAIQQTTLGKAWPLRS
ncbi:MAG: ribonuclease PH [Aureliella sp.]